MTYFEVPTEDIKSLFQLFKKIEDFILAENHVMSCQRIQAETLYDSDKELENRYNTYKALAIDFNLFIEIRSLIRYLEPLKGKIYKEIEKQQ